MGTCQNPILTMVCEFNRKRSVWFFSEALRIPQIVIQERKISVQAIYFICKLNLLNFWDMILHVISKCRYDDYTINYFSFTFDI